MTPHPPRSLKFARHPLPTGEGRKNTGGGTLAIQLSSPRRRGPIRCAASVLRSLNYFEFLACLYREAGGYGSPPSRGRQVGFVSAARILRSCHNNEVLMSTIKVLSAGAVK